MQFPFLTTNNRKGRKKNCVKKNLHEKKSLQKSHKAKLGDILMRKKSFVVRHSLFPSIYKNKITKSFVSLNFILCHSYSLLSLTSPTNWRKYPAVTAFGYLEIALFLSLCFFGCCISFGYLCVSWS